MNASLGLPHPFLQQINERFDQGQVETTLKNTTLCRHGLARFPA